MTTATIVGASGFVGSRLRERLTSDGVEVYAPPKGDPALFERDLGCVYYCAGLTADYAARPFDTIEAHVTLLAKVAALGRFKRLVYTSSTRLYDAGGSDPADEREPLRLNPAEPRHLYDLSKALGENVVLTQTGGRGAVARLANVFDWREDAQGFLSEWLIRSARGRTLSLASSPAIQRDYIHVDDVVGAMIAIGAREGAGIVNVAGGELLSNAEIAAVFEDEGWRIAFEKSERPAPPPRALVDKLRDLGVEPRSALDVIRGRLREFKAGAIDRSHA